MDDDADVVVAGTSAHCGTYRKQTFMREVAGPFATRFATPPVPRPRQLWAPGDTVAVRADAVDRVDVTSDKPSREEKPTGCST